MDGKINRMLLWGSFYAYIVTGMLVLMTGAILPFLMRDYNLSYSQSGLLVSLQAVGNLCAGLLSGIASEYWGRKTTLVLGAACFIVGFGSIPFTSSVFALYVLIFISGMGWGTLNTLVNSVVNDATNGRSSVLNLLHMFFSIGAFVAPLLVGLSTKLHLNWRFDVVFVALLAVILVFVFLRMPVETATSREEKGRLSFRFLSDIRFFVFIGILFFYVGTESSINGWVVTYLINSDIADEVTAQNILSALWIFIIVGRLLCAYLLNFFSREKVILGCCIGGIVFFILFLLCKTPVIITICVFGIGLCIAGIYPTTVANAGYLIKGSGIASGIMLSGGGLGASVIPFIAGLYSQKNGIQAAMVITLLSFLLLLILVTFNGSRKVSCKATAADL